MSSGRRPCDNATRKVNRTQEGDMYWYKKTLTAENNVTINGLVQVINGFYSILERKGVAPGVGMFPQNHNSEDYSYSVYFSPACADYCPQFLERINAERCDKPNVSDVSFLWGDLNARALLA